MNVLHVLPVMNPSHGGPPAVGARLAAAQASAGHAVCITYHDAPAQRREIDESLKPIPGIEKVRLAPLSPRLRFGAIVPKATREALRSHLAQADVVQLHGVWDPLLWQSAVEARRARVPYIITPHGMLDPWCLQQGRLKKAIALRLTFRKMLQRAACLHLLNDDEARLMSPLGLSTPTRVIPNGVFLEEIEPLPRPGTFFAQHPELNGGPFVLFLSRLHYKKGLDYLADAFAAVSQRVPRARLVVAGPDGGARAEFVERVKELGTTDRVHLVGPLWGSAKLAAMVDATCFCLPSRQEGFSMAILEALACGTAVVISDACHFPEVAHARAGAVVALQPQAIAAAISDLLENPQRAADAGRNGRQLVQDRYTWRSIADQSLDMYSFAIARRDSSRNRDAA